MRGLSTLLLAVCAIGCSPAAGQPSLSQDAVILPGRMAARMLRQCSRSAPTGGKSTWQPSVGDILSLEAVLPKALMAHGPSSSPDWSTVQSKWRRQYVGIVLNGRRLIYGNYFPKNDEARGWRSAPQIVCDGGSSFFGVVYDLADHSITDIAFNGEA
jgi:hypothetical protein